MNTEVVNLNVNDDALQRIAVACLRSDDLTLDTFAIFRDHKVNIDELKAAVRERAIRAEEHLRTMELLNEEHRFLPRRCAIMP
jgi:hypothetical protein